MLRAFGFAVAGVGALAAAAQARPASTGFFAEGGIGATTFLPSTSKDADTGPAFDLRVGRDLFSWLSVGVYIAASSHEATVPPPEMGQYFQLYRGGADARLGGRFDRLALFVEGGVGAAMISSNILQKVKVTDPGEHYSSCWHGGAGAEYQLENRHYALGLAADAFVTPAFDATKALETRLYLRYTYGGG
jgi:hypothetical protein